METIPHVGDVPVTHSSFFGRGSGRGRPGRGRRQRQCLRERPLHRGPDRPPASGRRPPVPRLCGHHAYSPQLPSHITGFSTQPDGSQAAYLHRRPDQSGGPAFRVEATKATLNDSNGDTQKVLSVVAEPIGATTNTLHTLLLIELAVTAGALVLALAGGWWLVRLGLRPLEDVERTADSIAAGNLDQRVPGADDTTEVGRLARALNVMLERIESAFSARLASEARLKESDRHLRQFVADASHELRTPDRGRVGLRRALRARCRPARRRSAPGVHGYPLGDGAHGATGQRPARTGPLRRGRSRPDRAHRTGGRWWPRPCTPPARWDRSGRSTSPRPVRSRSWAIPPGSARWSTTSWPTCGPTRPRAPPPPCASSRRGDGRDRRQGHRARHAQRRGRTGLRALLPGRRLAGTRSGWQRSRAVHRRRHRRRARWHRLGHVRSRAGHGRHRADSGHCRVAAEPAATNGAAAVDGTAAMAPGGSQVGASDGPRRPMTA